MNDVAVTPGLIIAAPSSGSGKTVFTLGLLRHLVSQGRDVVAFKTGPDYIDPAFHGRATFGECFSLDPWAMREATLAQNVERAFYARQAKGTISNPIILCEGVMGLFDGATLDEGSTADLSKQMGWPVLLVIDARAQGPSAAAVLRGFSEHRPDISIAGVVFNRIGSERHAALIREACERALPHIPMLGFVPQAVDLELPSRHLGLVQASEHEDLERVLDRAAEHIACHVDVDALCALARPMQTGVEKISNTDNAARIPIAPLGQRIAVASDAAFAFRYPHIVAGWRTAGAEVHFFSPLAAEAPCVDADAVYLPGGYPELYGGRIAANEDFLSGLRQIAARGGVVFGECGGYMVMGNGIEDADGTRHAMAGLLKLETSFKQRKLHLGYRRARLCAPTPFGEAGQYVRGHEFHFAATLQAKGAPLFDMQDARGADLGHEGLVDGQVAGSFVHLIDRE